MRAEGAGDLPISPIRHGLTDSHSQSSVNHFDYMTYSLNAVYFDQNNNLAGLEWKDWSWYAQGKVRYTKTSNDQISLSATQIESRFKSATFQKSSLIVGFQTTRDNATSKTIKSVQPIYWSRSETVCKESFVKNTEEQAEIDPETSELVTDEAELKAKNDALISKNKELVAKQAALEA